MSLKGDVSGMELLDTIEGVKKGKKKAINKLSKYVDSGAITTELYDELIEKYGIKKKDKKKHELYLFGYPIKEYNSVLFFLSIIVAICILLSAIDNANFWVGMSAIYLLLSFLLYHFANTDDKQLKDYEITQLKQEIRKLESAKESDKHIIELLEKQLEIKKDN